MLHRNGAICEIRPLFRFEKRIKPFFFGQNSNGDKMKKNVNRTVPWTFAVIGETAIVMLINLLPLFFKAFFENEERFWLNAVFGTPIVFLSVFSFCFFGAVNKRRFFQNLCKERSALLPKSSLSGSVTFSVVLFAVKSAALFAFVLPAATTFVVLLKIAQRLPAEAAFCLFAFALLLLVFGICFFKKFSFLLFLSEYVYMICPQTDALGCISRSAEIMFSCRKEYSRLEKRLFVLLLPCFLIFPAAHAVHRRREIKNDFVFGRLFVPAAEV